MKKFKNLILACALLAGLHAGELKITNSTIIPVTITITTKKNKNSTDIQSENIEHEVQAAVILPNQEITINLDDKKFNDSTFLVQGTIITAPPIVPVVSNKCMINGYSGDVIFTQKNSQLICSVVQISANYPLHNQEDKR